jgi:hypothetical protein
MIPAGVAALLALVLIPLFAGGCTSGPAQPRVLRAPYESERVWAVVPFVNESGVSMVDGAAVADRFVSEIEEVDGIRCLPLNRTLAAMQQLGITSLGDARQIYTLMRAMQVDGIVIGTVTDWDPYKPLRFGAAVEVLSVASGSVTEPLDLRELTMPTTGTVNALEGGVLAISQASRLFDARNNETLRELELYATGRADESSALGTRVYELRLDLFTRFGAYVLVRDLLEQEAARLGVPLPGGRAERPPTK